MDFDIFGTTPYTLLAQPCNTCLALPQSRKMTLLNASLIELPILGQQSIAYLTCGNVRSYGPAH